MHLVRRSLPFLGAPARWPLWLQGALVVGGLQVALVVPAGPQADPDLFFYTRGALNWELQHPPGYTVLLSLLRRLWPSLWLPVGVQVATYALAAGALVAGLFPQGRPRWAVVAAWAWAGLEPVTAFYHASVLTESLFLSTLLLLALALQRWVQAPGRSRWAWAVGGASAGLLLLRHGGVAYLPVVGLAWAVGAWHRLRLGQPWPWHGLVAMALPPLLAVGLTWAGHRAINQAGYNNIYGIKWVMAGPYITPELLAAQADPLLLAWELQHRAHPSYQSHSLLSRYHAMLPLVEAYARHLRQQGADSTTNAYVLTDQLLDHVANHALAEAGPRRHLDWLLWDLHAWATLNRLDERPTLRHMPGMPTTYAELDALVRHIYPAGGTGPGWPWYRHTPWLNAWALVLAALWALAAALQLAQWRRSRHRLWLGLVALVPVGLVLLTLIPYKLRYVSAAYVPGGLWLLALLADRLGPRPPAPPRTP